MKGIKIKTDYVPKAKRIQKAKVALNSTSTASSRNLYQKCPICKKDIPVNEFEQHLRIELMDPKWKIQKDRELAKKRESNLQMESGDEIAMRISKFAQVRQDIFGNASEFEIQQKIEEQKRIAKQKETVTWDGRVNSINQVTRQAFGAGAATSIQQLREKFEEERKGQFGPLLPDGSFNMEERQLLDDFGG